MPRAKKAVTSKPEIKDAAEIDLLAPRKRGKVAAKKTAPDLTEVLGKIAEGISQFASFGQQLNWAVTTINAVLTNHNKLVEEYAQAAKLLQNVNARLSKIEQGMNGVAAYPMETSNEKAVQETSQPEVDAKIEAKAKEEKMNGSADPFNFL